MYLCDRNYCNWSGTILLYDENGQGHCPKCGRAFQGCVSPEKHTELTQRPAPAPISGGDSGESEEVSDV